MSNIFSGSSSPFAVPQSWDSIIIGGVGYGPIVGFGPTSIGGKVRIRGASRFYKIDIKNPPGSDGWTTTYRGLEPKQFDIIFSIWTQSQYDYFVNSVLPAIQYSGVKKQVQPLSVVHPTLSAIGIGTIYINRIGAIEQVSEDLMFECKVVVSEYLQPPAVNTTSTAIGAKTTNQATSPGVQAPTAVQQQINANNALRAQVAGIPATFAGPI